MRTHVGSEDAMQVVDFNEGWAYRHLVEAGADGDGEPFKAVSIPHDAMLAEPRTPTAASGNNGGWFEGRDYEYAKHFDPADFASGEGSGDRTNDEGPDDARSNDALLLEFEGVWHNAEVWVNGQKAAFRPYGYTNFYVDITGLVKAGKDNEVCVIARNSDQPNSRWYTGAGIHRPVTLWTAGKEHLLVNGLAVRTLSCGDTGGTAGKDAGTGLEDGAGTGVTDAGVASTARIAVGVAANAAGRAHVEIAPVGQGGVVAACDVELHSAGGDTVGDAVSDGVNVSRETVAASAVSSAAASVSSAVSTDFVFDDGSEPTYTATAVIDVPDAHLWSPESPNLYTCTVHYESASGCGTDAAETTFGIRTLEWGKHGLLINGKRTVLLGACIHADNGILGARTFPEAEERRVRLLKAQGYNAIRSAHNPCSKALLAACDRLGMLVLDEYVDQWYIHKTPHDYVAHFPDWWQRDLKDMVMKDRNHPSVIMYSTGNEVSETAQRRGIELTGAMTEYLHSLDPTRPVTCGVNIFFNLLSSIGFGQYSDKKAAKEEASAARRAAAGDKAARHKPVGSEFFNTVAGLMGAGFMKKGAALPMCDWVTRDAYANMDIAGYNYGIDRYEHDLKAYPDRLILGTETFCADAARFRSLAAKNPRLIGDFVWAGMDYLGETGVGAWEYSDYAPAHSRSCDWLTAGSGRLTLTGAPLGEALYTRVALAGETGPYIAVCPVNHTGEKHTPSAWKMSNAIPSWSWDGCEGRMADVEVYARAAEVTLRLNGKDLKTKRIGGNEGCIARFRVPYLPGTLEAVAWDAQGHEIGRSRLETAGEKTVLEAWMDDGSIDVADECGAIGQGEKVQRSDGGWRSDGDHLPEPGEATSVGAVGDVRAAGAADADGAGHVADAVESSDAMKAARITAVPGGIAFIHVQYGDGKGTLKPLARGRLKAQVTGGELLGFGCAAPFNPGRFDTGETGTYFGEALAVVRVPVDAKSGEDKVGFTVADESGLTAHCTVSVG